MWKIVGKSCKEYDLSVINFKLAFHLRVYCKKTTTDFTYNTAGTALSSIAYIIDCIPLARTYRNAYQAAGFAKKIGGITFALIFSSILFSLDTFFALSVFCIGYVEENVRISERHEQSQMCRN